MGGEEEREGTEGRWEDSESSTGDIRVVDGEIVEGWVGLVVRGGFMGHRDIYLITYHI